MDIKIRPVTGLSRAIACLLLAASLGETADAQMQATPAPQGHTKHARAERVLTVDRVGDTSVGGSMVVSLPNGGLLAYQQKDGTSLTIYKTGRSTGYILENDMVKTFESREAVHSPTVLKAMMRIQDMMLIVFKNPDETTIPADVADYANKILSSGPYIFDRPQKVRTVREP